MLPGIQTRVSLSFDVALPKVVEALKSEGFGILTEIDVRETLRAKLGVEFRPYRILGACNPPLAHRALQAELGAGVMLPCNVVVYDGGDHTVVIAVDPMETFAARSPELQPIASEVRAKLARVIERLA
jgi:uncharacterized protein (DUF302 family)